MYVHNSSSPRASFLGKTIVSGVVEEVERGWGLGWGERMGDRGGSIGHG